MKNKKYNHAFTLAFSVESDNSGKNITSEELIAGILSRISTIISHDISEIVEACGEPFDTFEIEQEIK